MDKENFFTKLRRVSAYTEKETAKLKICMQKPVVVRSSANQNEASARLVLKEVLYDAQKTKENASKQISGLQTSSKSFQETLDACGELCEVMRQQVDDLESYLQQYGYKKYKTADNNEQLPKENKIKDRVEEQKQAEKRSPEMEEKNSNEKLPCTPHKEPFSAPLVDPNKTPQLADFGVSQWTLDYLASKSVDGASHDLKTPGSFPSSIPSQCFARTPQHSKEFVQNAPFTNQTIFVTPGMFGNQHIPTETPSQFIDTKSYLLDSPVPPVLMSVKKTKPTTHDLRVTRRQDFPSPELELTSWRKDISVPVPPFQLHVLPASAEVTPPMPSCLAPQSSQLPMPPEPARLASSLATNTLGDALPSEPVQTSQQVMAKIMPVEPTQRAKEFGYHEESPAEPVRLAERFGQGITPDEPQCLAGTDDNQVTQFNCSVAGHPSQPITPKGHHRLDALALDDIMPQTPELTVTSLRFMNSKLLSSGKQGNQRASPPNDKLDDASQPPSAKDKLKWPITPITEAEFSQVVAYLQRLFPIEVINQKVTDINAMLANKQDASFICEAEIQTLQLGPKTKAFVLLLAKLGRLNKRKRPDSDEQAYYVIDKGTL